MKKIRNFAKTILIDVVFLAVMGLIGILTEKTYMNNFQLGIFILIIYYLVLVSAYSTAKMMVWKVMISEKFKISKIAFLRNNFLFITSVFLALFIGYMLIKFIFISNYIRTYFSVYLVVVFLVSYVLLNNLQILWIKGKGLESLNIELKKYLKPFIVELIIIMAIMAISFLSRLFYQILMILFVLFANAFNRHIFFRTLKKN